MSYGRPRKATAAVSSLLVALALGAFAWLSPAAAKASLTPIHGRSMWIWYLNRSDGGSVPAILARARAAGVATLIIKSSDGANYWSQFSPSVVQQLRAGGLRVCAWQYVYGTDPVAEADMGARAVRAGAQCLVIDAEAEYEGRYASAATYVRELRRLVGRDYPVGLASFPYVDYHPAFPYSVFLGPGGAQFDMPQMYWVEIGLGVGTVFRHTYTENRIYRRPIFPLGQTYGSPLTGDIELFRGLAVRYDSPGVSWWDYAWTSADSFWPALSGLYTPAAAPPLGYPDLAPGSTGDAVLWLQEHLAREFPNQRTTGLFGSLTLGILQAFQSRHRLLVTGSADAETWRALLRLDPVATPWSVTASGAGLKAGARRDRSSAPSNASLPAHGYEIPEVGSDRSRGGGSPAEP